MRPADRAEAVLDLNERTYELREKAVRLLESGESGEANSLLKFLAACKRAHKACSLVVVQALMTLATPRRPTTLQLLGTILEECSSLEDRLERYGLFNLSMPPRTSRRLTKSLASPMMKFVF